MFILATLAVIVVIGALFIGNIRQNTRDAIVLPDTAQSVRSESQPDENKPALLEVTRENVQSLYGSPSGYSSSFSDSELSFLKLCITTALSKPRSQRAAFIVSDSTYIASNFFSSLTSRL